MRLKVKLLVLFFILSLVSCKIVSFNDCIGVYDIRFHPGYSKLELNQDTTFTYFIATDLAGDMTYSGTWKKRGSKIFLNQTSPMLEEYDDDDSYIEEKYINDFDSIKIEILYKDSIPFVPVNVRFDNSKKHYETDNIGTIVLKKIKFKNISLGGLLGTYKYNIKNSKANYFIFHIHNFDDIPILKKNGIVPLRWKCYKEFIQPISKDGKNKEVYKRNL